ncbi:hypothetical protein [Alteromonas sp. CYL-A6]|uniref:hypothetical protein n=1 Tax=Alteromonas nitratireducens TaxID=3390813 RepID=UPI0034C46F1C
MNPPFARLLLLCLMLLAAMQAQAAYTPTPDNQVQAFQAGSLSAITFRSPRLPAWQLAVTRDESHLLPGSDAFFYQDITQHQALALRVSRQLGPFYSQRIFATVQTSTINPGDALDWVVLPSTAGVAASLGWRLGDPNRLNMAVEIEHRNIGNDIDISSLRIGVHYYF